MKKGLGKGFNALIDENTFDVEGGITELRLSDIEPDRDQPRRDFEPEALNELTDSIKQHGVISPIVVTAIEGERYRIIAGERRWRASKLAGLEKIPVVIKEYSPEQLAEVSLIENLQREDLNPLEEAFGYKRLMDTYKLTQEEVSQKVSKSRSAVANALRLLALPEQVLDFVRTGELSAGHARTLLGLTDADTVIAAANKVISEELSVRKTEELVKKLKSEPVIKKELDSEVLLAINELESRARQGTGNKVKIRHSAKNNGKIEIFYGSTAELEKLIDMLSGR